jgi:hypothetical protein
MGQPNGTRRIRWRSKIGPHLGENMFAQLAALPSWSHDRQEPGPITLANDNNSPAQAASGSAAERGPGQGLWYNDFCVFGVAAMSWGFLPGLFW